MCHFVLLPLPHSNQQILIISIILFCGTYRLCFQLVHGSEQSFITNHTEKITSKLKPNDEIIILGILLQHILFLDLSIDAKNIPFHLKSTDGMIVFNNKLNGMWQNEIKLTPNPLLLNTSFIIDILIDGNDDFNISFNEHTLFNVIKREPLENIKRLHIYGNFTLKSVRIMTFSKDEDNSMKRTLIIGIAITCVLIIITGMGVFYITRRHCIHSNSKHRSNNDHDSTVESLASFRTKRTAQSNISYLTGNSSVL